VSEHPDLDELWLDLVEGSLPQAEARAVRAHVESCEECRARLRKLERAHEVSLRAGRILAREERDPVPPPAVEDAILRAARTPPARRGRWIAGALVAAAAAAVVLAVVRPWERGSADAAWLQGTLAALASPPGARGRGDPVASAAEEAGRRWEAGDLTPRSVTLRCPQGEVTVAGLVAGGGGVAVIVTRIGDRADVHLYRDDGAEVGAARLVAGSRTEHALPPLPQSAAMERLERRKCPPAPRPPPGEER
jgi:hypothetical protein